ncbi:hypothetical protein D3C81_1733190 [compost metagenome]
MSSAVIFAFSVAFRIQPLVTISVNGNFFQSMLSLFEELSISDSPIKVSVDIPNPIASALIIGTVRGRFRESISDTRLLVPKYGTRSACFKPFSSILNRMASIGSGLSTGYFCFS